MSLPRAEGDGDVTIYPRIRPLVCGRLHGGDPCGLPPRHDQPCCPSADCGACNGEACWKCGAGLSGTGARSDSCDHDVLDRHDEG